MQLSAGSSVKQTRRAQRTVAADGASAHRLNRKSLSIKPREAAAVSFARLSVCIRAPGCPVLGMPLLSTQLIDLTGR